MFMHYICRLSLIFLCVSVFADDTKFNKKSIPLDHDMMRIKDITSFEGIRDNYVVGYGVLSGLSGTGDNLSSSPIAQSILQSSIAGANLNITGKNNASKNIAAVLITGKVSSYGRQGNVFDVQVSTIGTATDVKGGILMPMMLRGADGVVYAMAQGKVKVSENSGKFGKHTSGVVIGGGIIERETRFKLNNLKSLNIALSNPDIETATNIQKAINASVQGANAAVMDPGTIRIKIPRNMNVTSVLQMISPLKVHVSMRARIVVNENTGSVVISKDVKLDPVAVAKSNLLINVRGSKEEQLGLIDRNTSLLELVNGLNKLGIKPADMISIFRDMARVGAINAEIVVVND